MKIWIAGLILCLNHVALSQSLLDDRVDLLDSVQQQMIARKLQDFQDSSGIKMKIVIDEKRPSRGMQDNSVDILIGLNDRTSEIHIADNLMSYLTLEEIERIRKSYLVENFRSSRFFEGLDQASSILMVRVSTNADKREYNFYQEIIIGLAIILLLIIAWRLYQKS